MPMTSLASSLAVSRLLFPPMDELQSNRRMMFFGKGVTVVTYQGLSRLSYLPQLETRLAGNMVVTPSADPKYCHFTFEKKKN